MSVFQSPESRILLKGQTDAFSKKNSNFFLYFFLVKIRLKMESSAFHSNSKPRNKNHRSEGLLRFKKPIISRKLYIVFQSRFL